MLGTDIPLKRLNTVQFRRETMTPATELISDESMRKGAERMSNNECTRSESNRPRRRMRPCESKASVLYGMNDQRVNSFGKEFEQDTFTTDETMKDERYKRRRKRRIENI
jgi:hypothetical protein